MSENQPSKPSPAAGTAPHAADLKPTRPAPKQSTDAPTGASALHAPWRIEYREALGDDERAKGTPRPTDASFLGRYWAEPERDVANHVIVRTAVGMILLNAYPYSSGHLLVALGEPRPKLLDYDADQRAALWSLVDTATDLLERTLNPQGVNIGVNQGRAAGAGVPQHLHVHLVPRWSGDVNFIDTIGRVRVIPSSLEHMAERFRGAWQEMIETGESAS